jgi:hypothetical protein
MRHSVLACYGGVKHCFINQLYYFDLLFFIWSIQFTESDTASPVEKTAPGIGPNDAAVIY